jgi:spoIIIJ-associated protein
MNQIELVKETVSKIFEFINLSAPVDIAEKDGEIKIAVVGDNLNFLIGTHGAGLSSLESYLNLLSFKNYNDKSLRVTVDINDYKVRKTEKIHDMARRAIDKVRFQSEEVHMPPMNPAERRLVHTFVAEYNDVATESIGDEPFRRVVLKKKL